MSSTKIEKTKDHPFLSQPHRTLAGLAVPVLFSLVAEPLTGLADTAFVARLPGSEPVAALGVGTVAFSSIFWAFSFLGVGTQTEVAKDEGGGNHDHAVKVVSLAIMMAACIGIVLMLGAMPVLKSIGSLLGAAGAVNELACEYMFYRLLGAPAVLVSIACFGALRGAQDMRTPLYVAVGINLINLLLDWLLIFGVGPFPELGVAGAAIASTVSQWIGAAWGLVVVAQSVGLTFHIRGAGVAKLLKIGGDLFVRTGMVLLFLALCTRVANHAGANEGAAYQAIRQFFIFAALFLDAFAITGQSLVGYFLGAGEVRYARSVARMVCIWSVGTGLAMCAAMIVGENGVAWLLVPPDALLVFGPAWWVVALTQPLGALSFATDGIHWGTGDFRYLRNAMIVASCLAGGLVYSLDQLQPVHILVYIWMATALWTFIRAAFGLVRIWPGIGEAPLRMACR
ncbi:MATE family efflux transporter [Pseudodesulfovibrio sp. zrk46]|uniref:MATE family efflux transporter n=1 Tax=Pseudodesulfovibrio sp. zrk46 TaxID=2725288 RepID=UPI001448AE66|nr:MATE family efflux transporter [Pseudodesulfovibrio sp. zrk46]QJB57871.1 MATE family efflux transporter [Pseudodesulfovibrio sp. zrk46]